MGHLSLDIPSCGVAGPEACTASPMSRNVPKLVVEMGYAR